MSHAWHEEMQAEIKAGARVSDRDIADKVRHAVLMQRLPPGTKLPEITLGEVFGVSRSVVRKALTRLASEHVIDQRPNQVARVRAPSIEETRETFEARRLVEGEVAAQLAGRLSPEALAALTEQARNEVEDYRRGDEPARIERSLTLHHRLAEYAPNRVLGGMLTDLVLRTSIVVALYKRAGLASCYQEGQHDRLLEHLAAGDAEAARGAVHDHLDGLEAMLDLSPREARIDLMSILGRAPERA